MPSRPDALRALAERAGIIDSYLDQSGREERQTSDDTRAALLSAMGFAADDEIAARRSLDAWHARDAEALVPAARVVRGPENASDVLVRVPDTSRGAIEWRLVLEGAGNAPLEHAGRAKPNDTGNLTLPLPARLEPGYHRLRLQLDVGGRVMDAEQLLIVSPRSCPPARQRLGRRRFGIAANLYALRSERNWGVGDLTDLGELVRWAAGGGGAFVGVNPLHALRNVGGDISPYSPVSRIYRNPLYLNVEAVPELADCVQARKLIASTETQALLADLRTAKWLDYERIWLLKSSVLDALYATFRERHLLTASPRARAFGEFVQREGAALDEHATFLAIEETLRAAGHHGPWRDWPAGFRDPASSAVREFREREAARVDRHRWLQFELDRQVAAAANVAREARMRVGLYQDLAIGCSPDGSDAWANQRLLLEGISLGAPPDQYSESGQDWGLPPINPHALAAQGYAYWIALVRAAMRHAGALRIDHILGLFRQFWIPGGRSGRDGAYVRFPTSDLLGILALEASRSGAIIVGEDLGTVPPEVGPTLRDWEVLGTKVLYFERDDAGGFTAAEDYEELALTVAETHDMVPLAGYWAGRDIAIRESAGLLNEETAAEARQERVRERAALAERLRAEGGLTAPQPDESDIIRSAHAFLGATPSLMVGLSLDDIAGETEPVNVPGVTQDRYPSWTRRLTPTLEALTRDAIAAERLAACEERRDA